METPHSNSIIHPGAKIGENVEIGEYCIIEDGVEIGDNTIIRNYVELRKGTVIGKDCYLDSHVISSGDNSIGDRVTIRFNSIIARGCEIGDDTFIAARLMTNNLDSEKTPVGGAKIGKKCFIGTNVVIHHGINICDRVTLGAMSFINKDITTPGTYFGNPAKKYK